MRMWNGFSTTALPLSGGPCVALTGWRTGGSGMTDLLASGRRPAASYHCHPEVIWAVESARLTLIRRNTGTRLALGYPEAALWDLLGREVSLQRAIRMMAAIAGMELQATRAWIIETIGAWAQEG